MELYQIMCLLGIPSMILTLNAWIIAQVKKQKMESDALKKGMQALLRDRLLEHYKEAKSNGGADYQSKENFLNMYNNYHALGQNGVMDTVLEEYMNLPMTEV